MSIQKNHLLSKDFCHKTFLKKSKGQQKLINDTLFILGQLGIPLDSTPRKLEKMALAILSLLEITKSNTWSMAKGEKDGVSKTTREIIEYINNHFKEDISSGSYDDIRRKDLLYPLLANIVIHSQPNAATNVPTRGYSINQSVVHIFQQYGNTGWSSLVKEYNGRKESLAVKLKKERDLTKMKVTLPGEVEIELTSGKHNELQKHIIEEFLPRYGYESMVLYVGDTKDKFLYLDKDKLKEIGFFEITHDELPDVIAYSSSKNWIYFIEAVHSANPISSTRLLQVQSKIKSCMADIIYITAFNDKKEFRRHAADIAWETEVWIAEDPDHLIHFDGEKFLGPYKE